MPSHLSGAEVIHILEDKKKKEGRRGGCKGEKEAEREERRQHREKKKEIWAARETKKAKAEGVVEEEAVEVAEQLAEGQEEGEGGEGKFLWGTRIRALHFCKLF